MMFNRSGLLVPTLVCSLFAAPAVVVLAQQAPASSSPQAQPSNQDQDPNFNPLTRQRSDKERFKAQKAPSARVEGDVQDLAQPRSSLHYYRPGTEGVPQSEQRRRARRFHRTILGPPQSRSRLPREQLPRRALSPHSLCQRAFRGRRAGMEDGSRSHLHHVGCAGQHRCASIGRPI